MASLSSLMFTGEARAYPSEAPFSCFNRCKLLSLPTKKIRLGWKDLPGTNALV
jgi:hypothetical protein